MRALNILGLALGVALAPPRAEALFYDMYRSDYPKGTFCEVIGAACASDDNPENSFFQNPASLESGEAGLNYDFDFDNAANLEPGMKGNNDVHEYVLLGGVAWTGPRWGLGVAFSARQDNVNSKATLLDDQGRGHSVTAKDRSRTLLFFMPFAYKLKSNLSIGVSLYGIYYQELLQIEGSANSHSRAIDAIPTMSATFGGLYWDEEKRFRIGSWFRMPLTYYVNLSFNVQSISSIISVKEDVGLYYPWIWANGASYMPWKDDRTFFLDVVTVGSTLDGFERTYDTFSTVASDKTLRSKGRSVIAEPHAGWRSSWTRESRGSYMIGTYYESSRWEGLSGRIHGTAGVAYKVPSIAEFLVGVDVARDYAQLMINFR